MLQQLINAKAKSTSKRYIYEIQKFHKWCKASSLEPVPPFSVAVIISYLNKVYSDSNSYSTLILSHSALKWFHSFLPDILDNPLDSPLCKMMLESAKRTKNPVKKKQPLSSNMLRDIIDKYGSLSASLKDLRTATLCSLGFVGFFRYNELSNISLSHLNFFPKYLRIFVPQAKNDVYREGNYVYINRLNNNYCPVALLERYIQFAKLDLRSDELLFRQVSFHESSNSYTLRSQKLSYTRCRELFKSCLKELGYNEREFGLHSLRSGGATSAVRNSTGDLSERLLKLHGRWKSDIAKDMYILEDIDKRLSVSNNLGL